MRIIIFITHFLITSIVSAQSIKVGDWRDHFSYSFTYDVCQLQNKIYVSTDRALFSYNLEDNSISRLNTINKLSDAGVSSIQTSGEALIVGYDNGNLDFIKGGQTSNLPDIMRASLIGNKRINFMQIDNEQVYLSCGFGIVLVDIRNEEVIDTYFIGDNATQLNIKSTVIANNFLYAASTSGLHRASLNGSSLANYQTWETIPLPFQEEIELMASFNNKIFISKRGSTFNTDVLYVFDGYVWKEFLENYSFVNIKATEEGLLIVCRYNIMLFDGEGIQIDNIGSGAFGFEKVEFRSAIIGKENEYWIADQYNGLIYYKNTTVESIYPSGPFSSDVFQITNIGSEILLAHGSRNENWDPTWNKSEISKHELDNWTQTSFLNEIDLGDIVAVNKQGKDIFSASWQQGIMKISETSFLTLYNETNSSLQKRAVSNDWIYIGDIQFDSEGNLWCTNSQTYEPVSVKYVNNQWQSFSLGSSVIETDHIGKLVVDKNNQKWIQIRNKGIVVFDETRAGNKTYKLGIGEGLGNLNSNRVFSIAEDLDGEIWVGTEDGVCVFYSPEDLFEGEEASKITVTYDGFNSYLLDGQQINDIEIDGANRKWFALNNNGVIVTSENGSEQLYHFTKDNSPLFSNKVLDVEINNQTGEAFFATDKGLISYRSAATEGSTLFSNVKVFPNPIHPEYDGLITITGLIEKTIVKITDISGNLIFETESLGGQAIWDGKSLSGKKAHTGIYLVFCSDQEGDFTHVTKLLFVRG